MALNASGPISLAGSTTGQSIAVELGLSATGTISLNDAAVRTLAGVPSGAIIMPTNFYGKANEYAFSISTNQVNANLRSLAVSAGWNQSTKLIATINGGVYVYSNSTGTPGLTINGSFPNGVTLINNGYILGMGGDGSIGAGGVGQSSAPGGSGGTALSVSSAVTINNSSGTIGGGGGGGGGGASYNEMAGGGKSPPYIQYGWAGGGGGGGQTGLTNSSGGPAGPSNYNQRSADPTPGAPGTSSGGGSGGQPGSAPNSSFGGGAGGVGGGWGSSGATGSGARRASTSTPAGSGGSAGAAISGNSNITWNGFGTRLGGIS
jgi:hypothetical protein